MSSPYPEDQFGYTNDLEHLKNVRDFVALARIDGWSIEPTYSSESVDRACRLKREGFQAQVLMREMQGSWKACTHISIWGPDGLAIEPPFPYDWEKIKAGVTTCGACGKTGVGTQRYSFAGRCCAGCRPEMARQHERGNWTA